MSWLLDVEPRPALLVLPPGEVDLDEAHAAIEHWEHYSGKKLDPTQRLAVEIMMAVGPDDLWAAGTTGREMPRQNGKGDEIEVVEFWGITQRGERILHTVHEAVMLTTEAQERILQLFRHPDLEPRLAQVWTGVGQQKIKVADSPDAGGGKGGTIWYRTRTKGGARGVDKADRVVCDEAQHVTGPQLEALTSTQTVSDNPQLNALGTSALPDESHWWWEVRKRALLPDPGAFGYIGHTAEKVYLDEDGKVIQEPVDVEDRSLWLAANPALMAGRGTGMRFFEQDLHNLGKAGFAQEHLGVWAPYPNQDGGFLPVDIWREQVVVDPKLTGVTFGISVAHDGAAASVASAGRLSDGSLYVDNVKCEPGTDWLVKDVVDRWKRKKIPVRLNPGSVEGAFIRKLEQAGVEIVGVTGREYQQACGEVLDSIKNRVLFHLGQPVLNQAVAAAQRREVGKEGGWVWADPLSGVDLSPLKAATLALSGVSEPEDRSAVNNVW